MMWYLFLIFGFLSGLIGGMGMGGGTLLIPLLTIFMGINQIIAQGFNLIAFLPMSLVAIYIHIKNGLIKSDYLIAVIVSGIVFAIVGSILANLISKDVLRILFGVFLIVLSLFQFIEMFKK